MDDSAVIVGALLAGFACGLGPLIASVTRKCIAVGLVGMMICIGCGYVLGLLLALPVSIFYSSWILKSFHLSENDLKSVAMRSMR